MIPFSSMKTLCEHAQIQKDHVSRRIGLAVQRVMRCDVLYCIVSARSLSLWGLLRFLSVQYAWMGNVAHGEGSKNTLKGRGDERRCGVKQKQKHKVKGKTKQVSSRRRRRRAGGEAMSKGRIYRRKGGKGVKSEKEQKVRAMGEERIRSRGGCCSQSN